MNISVILPCIVAACALSVLYWYRRPPKAKHLDIASCGIMTRFGKDKEGNYPSPGTIIQFRCYDCGEIQNARQPRPGCVLVYCDACHERLESGLYANRMKNENSC